MFARSVSLPQIGRLRRGWGMWYGRLPLRGLDAPLDLRIQIPRREPVEPFAEQARLFADRFDRLRAEFAGELFETYEFYKRTDLETEGGYTAADYAKHPAIASAVDVWRVLRPYRLRLGPAIGKYAGNSYLLMQVDWPNPHYFQMFLEASADGFKYVHTEFVG
jgi:hypothetical protein